MADFRDNRRNIMFPDYGHCVKRPGAAAIGCGIAGLTVTVDEKDKRMIKQFGVRLQAVRIASGIPDASLAAADLGIEAPRYRKYERGQAIPPVPVLLAICAMFNTTSDFLLFGRTERTRAAVKDTDL